MCDPVSGTLAVASLLSTAGGYMANQQAQRQQKKAMNNAVGAYNDRLDDLQGQASQQVQQGIDSMDVQRQGVQREGEEQRHLSAILNNITPATASADATSSDQPRVVQDAYSRAMGDANTEAQANATRQARLNAWQGNSFLNDILLGRTGQEIGKLSNFAAGWQPVYQAEMAAAQQKGGGMRTLGSILQGVGAVTGLASGAAAAGMFGGAGSAGALATTPAAAGGMGDAAALAAAESVASGGAATGAAGGGLGALTLSRAAANPWLSPFAGMAPSLFTATKYQPARY